MFSSVILLVFIIFRAETAVPDNQEIVLSVSNDWNFPHKVVKGKPLNIILENIFNIEHVWCNKYQVSEEGVIPFDVSISNYNNGSIINIPNITNEMSTKWVCLFLEKYHGGMPYTYRGKNYTAFNKYFTLHVQGAKSVKLTINEFALMPVETESMYYDGETQYSYLDGEFVDLACSKDYTKDSLYIKYYDAYGTALFQTNSFNETGPLHFRASLNAFHENSYIECVYSMVGPIMEYNYRTTFIMKRPELDTRSDYVIVSVNGLQLVPIRSNTTKADNLKYQYYFIEGETLNITCGRSNEQLKGQLKLFYDDVVPQQTKARSDSNGDISIQLNTNSTTHNTTVSCGLYESSQKLFARIRLLHDFPLQDFLAVRVFGLPPKNVLYQYTTSNKWTIAYQYTENETLTLTCVNKDLVSVSNTLQWVFEGKILGAKSNINYNTIQLTSTTTITLEKYHNGSKLLCRKMQSGPIKNRANEVEILFNLKSELGQDGSNGASDKGDIKLMALISVIFVCIIIFTITTVCLICWCKRAKIVKHTENEYEYLSNQNDSPIPPFPNQWENQYEDCHYTKIDENVMLDNPSYSESNKILYSLPNKRRSNTSNAYSENVYTEIDDYCKYKTDIINNAKQGRADNISNIGEDTNYDKLRRSNIPIGNNIPDLTKSYEDLPKSNKTKRVTFKQNNLRTGHYINTVKKCGQKSNVDHSRQSGNHYCANEQEKGYANSFTELQIKPKCENNVRDIVQAENKNNDLEYDEPYSYSNEIVNCDNEFYSSN